MTNPDGTYTREEHRAAIMGLYTKNLESGMADGKIETDPRVLAKQCESFMEGAKKLFDAQTRGDLWFFELYHHLDDCKNVLNKQTSPRDMGKGRETMTLHFSVLFYGLALGSLLFATFIGDGFAIPLRPYFASLAALVFVGFYLQLIGY